MGDYRFARRAEVVGYSVYDDLRDAIVDYITEDGVNATCDNVLVTKGAKYATELALRV